MSLLYRTAITFGFMLAPLLVHAEGGTEVKSTETPPISTQELVNLTKRCPQKIEALHEKRQNIPRELAREFSVMLGAASDECLKLQKVVEYLQVGARIRDHYLTHIKKAQAAASQEGGLSPDETLGAELQTETKEFNDDAIESAPLASGPEDEALD
ncbi:MAG: hypothetical protein H2057_04670 [Alphaproteobacteria bacterium]|nr:hypothetical protein [Alphaproteobacteria bacterium]